MDIQSIEISVKKPCSEKIENFKPTSTGGYCSSCEKEVMDFRKMSDKEVVAYFSQAKGSTCGYFDQSQLKKYEVGSNVMRKPAGGLRYRGLMGFSLLSALSLNTVKAEETSKTMSINATVQAEQNVASNLEEDNKQLVGSASDDFSGVITDSQGQRLPGVSVIVKGTTTGTLTDFDGRYSLSRSMVKRGDILVISFIGCKAQEIKLTKERNDVQMEDDTCILVGEVATHTTFASQPTFWQRIRNWFR